MIPSFFGTSFNFRISTLVRIDVVRLEAGQHARLGACGKDYVLCFDCFLRAIVGRDLDLAAACQLRPALDDLYLVLPHQHLDALGVLADDLVLTIVYLAPVKARIIAEDTFVAGVNEVVPNIGSVEECFGGNATDKKAGSAEPRLLFYERGLQAVLASRIAAEYPPGPLPMTIRSYVIHSIIVASCTGLPDLRHDKRLKECFTRRRKRAAHARMPVALPRFAKSRYA